MSRVVGIDGAGKRGWIGLVVDPDGCSAGRLGCLEAIIDWAEPVDAIGIDIPIGLVAEGFRRADAEARDIVGPRRSSVFYAPHAGAVDARSYEEANAQVPLGAAKMSRQAWALVPKIKEAAAVAADDGRVHEVHPEVSFCEMAHVHHVGEHLVWSKKTWNGLHLRRRLLEKAGIRLPDQLPEAGVAGADDVVDAAAAAWSARRIATGTALSLPQAPEDCGGRRLTIWY